MVRAMDIGSSGRVRLLAPVALVAFVLILVIVISTTGSGSSHTTISKTELEKERDLGLGPYGGRRQGGATTATQSTSAGYTVKSGDTLGGIAARTGVSVSRIEQLNPSVTPPHTLLSGERLRLK
jgi:LysM repeat protein